MPASTPDLFDVAVVGTGTAGLTAALGCSQAGLRVALIGPPARRFAPSAEAPWDARIYALAPATVAEWQRLKVWPQVDAARMQPAARMRIAGDAGGELVFDAWRAHATELATIGEEGELLRVLPAACAFAPGVTALESNFESMVVGADAATIALADGRSLTARLVVGADGAHSAVRAAAGIGARSEPYGQTAVVANFACARPHEATAWQWFTDEGVVALLPLPGQAVSLVWSAPQALANELAALAPAALAVRVQARSGGVLGELTPLGGSHAFALRKLTVDQLVGPRVALLGDAAHVVHPLAGQGLNLGQQDVSELLRVLAARESFRDPGDLVLLRRYARRRAEAIALMRGATDGLARLFGADDPLLRRLRNLGLSLVDAAAPVKRALIGHAMG
ncbi:MAG: FAD-dependent monooxygenase [Burkholderiales bacterium]|nr:FAD-dependent monooxygenase [Burkholderiales bacterium]